MRQLSGNHIFVGKNVHIAPDARIRGDNISIGDYVTISSGVDICVPNGISIGCCSFLGPRVSIQCLQAEIGSYLWAESDVEIGRGGHFGSPESVVRIGRGVFLGPRVVINPNCDVTIGHQTGLGAGVGIWTHGAYLPVTEGFPAKFAPVRIGSKVWIPGQTQVLPGVTIGDNTVISMMSLVNRDIPPGSLAGGIPVKILKEGAFPQPVDLPAVLADLAKDFLRLAQWKSLDVSLRLHGNSVDVLAGGWVTTFDFESMTVKGDETSESEDFRDFVRRRGVRFFTGKPFRGMHHPDVARWL